MSSSLEHIYEPGIVDPGIPVENATAPFWHSSPHRMANHQSPWPTSRVDVVIIGSGITGTSLARALLNSSPQLSIVLIDARSLCSGATARNGGHIKTMAYAVWNDRKKCLGVDEAIRVTAFEHSHLKAMTDVILENDIDCDLAMTDGVDAYYNRECFQRATEALDDMRAHIPYLGGKYKVYTDTHMIQDTMKLSSRCVGVIVVPAASLWPYKFVMGLLSNMIDADRLNVQAHTTVREILDHPDATSAQVVTNRGVIKANHIVHATNGWIGHLLPELRPFISPVRGNVVHFGATVGSNQFPTNQRASVLGLDSRFSYWLRYADKDYDYLIQRAAGDVVVGRANTGRKSTGDDNQTDLTPIAHLRGFGCEVAASAMPDAATHITHAWSGILGFTQDASPLVGRIPFPGRGRQWVCGGYHGIGMVKAFRAGQMLAGLVLGKPLDESYPRSFLLTDKRIQALRKSLNNPTGQIRSKL